MRILTIIAISFTILAVVCGKALPDKNQQNVEFIGTETVKQKGNNNSNGDLVSLKSVQAVIPVVADADAVKGVAAGIL